MNNIKEVLDTVDREITAEVMSELLMDDQWSTWKMFEGLASDYLSGSADVRKGIDLACSALTGWYLSSIAEQILERAAELESEDEEY
jgi:hypothetical protein